MKVFTLIFENYFYWLESGMVDLFLLSTLWLCQPTLAWLAWVPAATSASSLLCKSDSSGSRLFPNCCFWLGSAWCLLPSGSPLGFGECDGSIIYHFRIPLFPLYSSISSPLSFFMDSMVLWLIKVFLRLTDHSLIFFIFFTFSYLRAGHVWHCTHVEVREQLAGIGPLLPPCGSWVWNSDSQA